MNKVIVFLMVILFLIQLNNLCAQFADSTKYIGPQEKENRILKNNIGIYPLYLIIGAIDIGFEHRIIDRLSVELNYAFGKIWFTDIEKYYEVGLKYYMKKQSNTGLYIKSHVNSISLKTETKNADVINYGMFVGYRWLISNFVSIDLYGGLYFSSDDKVVFTETKGNTTKTIDIGGFRQSGNFQIGISF